MGAALAASHRLFDEVRPSLADAPCGGDAMAGALLGPEFGTAEIESALDYAGGRYETLTGRHVD